MTDGDQPTDETHVDEDRGLWIPPNLRDFTSQIVFRTPRSTIQHFGNEPLDGYYGLINESHFGDPAEMRDAKNPELAPNRVRIQPQGEESVELDVDLEPEIRTDGGLDIQRYRVDRAQSVSYGPAGSASEGWALRFGSEDGERVVVRLDEDAMFHLWTEVHNVPWPSREDDRHDLQREIVARVEDAGFETLREVLDVLGGDRDA